MDGGLDIDDPDFRTMVVDMFVDIATLEHLIRERYQPQVPANDARFFGVLNYLIRRGKPSEKVATLAWTFQVDDAMMLASVDKLTREKCVELDWVDGERHVFLTDSGRAKHRAFVDGAAPDVLDILSDFDPDALRLTAETLKELRRTFDNLPDR